LFSLVSDVLLVHGSLEIVASASRVGGYSLSSSPSSCWSTVSEAYYIIVSSSISVHLSYFVKPRGVLSCLLFLRCSWALI
jgi:hypothetical protein